MVDNTEIFRTFHCGRCKQQHKGHADIGQAYHKFMLSGKANRTVESYTRKLDALQDILERILGVTYHKFLLGPTAKVEEYIKIYLTLRKDQGATRATVVAELAQWKKWALEFSRPDILTPRVQHTLDNMFPKARVTTQRVKRPISFSLLHNIYAELQSRGQGADEIGAWMVQRDAVWLGLGFFGLLRKSEICAVKVSDFALDAEGMPYQVRIRHSKNDPAGLGEWVPLPRFTGLNFDYRALVKDFLNRLASWGWTSDDYVITKYVHKKVTKQPFGKGGLWARLKELLSRELTADQLKEYGTHSMRRGGTTHYRTLGMQQREIMKIGRWRTSCFDIYDETDMRQVAYEQERILRAPKPWATKGG
jgi:integrase